MAKLTEAAYHQPTSPGSTAPSTGLPRILAASANFYGILEFIMAVDS